MEIMTTVAYALAVFGAGVAGVELAGFYPAAGRPAALRRQGSALLIGLLAGLVLALAATALWLGLTRLPWTTVVIAGGLALLLAPLAFQALPGRFWDSRAGVCTTALAIGGLLLVLLRSYVW
jgi:hypothetical protein